MTTLFMIPPFLGCLLLAPHFLRGGNILLMGISLIMIALLFVRRPWASYSLQAYLLFGAVEWVRTTLFLLAARKATGAPYTRLVVILGSVSLVTALSALLLSTQRLKARFGRNPGNPENTPPNPAP